MLKSMTSYGRASLDTQVGHCVIEIQSVNRKFLEVNVSLPRELTQFDIEVKKWLSPHLTRGHVTVKVNVIFEKAVPFIIRPNLPLARQLKAAWSEIIKDLDLDHSEFRFAFLEQIEGLLIYEENFAEEGNYREALKQTLEAALKVFIDMKVREGAILQADISQRLLKMRQFMQIVERKAPFAPVKYREKLVARLDELVPGYVENEERILREIALFAEKIDITEELTRFYCHLEHFEELIYSQALAVGKTLEFIVQELNREVNTISSKSSDLDIARAVIDIKSELERIREQIQNIE